MKQHNKHHDEQHHHHDKQQHHHSEHHHHQKKAIAFVKELKEMRTDPKKHKQGQQNEVDSYYKTALEAKKVNVKQYLNKKHFHNHETNFSAYMLEDKNMVINKVARMKIRRLFFRGYLRHIKREVRDLYIYMKQRKTEYKSKKISYDKWERPLYKLTRVRFEMWQDIRNVLLKHVHRQSYTTALKSYSHHSQQT